MTGCVAQFSPYPLPFGNTEALAMLHSDALSAIEQGIWTVVSYLAEIDANKAVTLAHQLDCNPSAIHDFDWERFESVFGSRPAFLQQIRSSSASKMASETAVSLTGIYTTNRKLRGNYQWGGSDADRIHRIGIIVGSAAALGYLNKSDRQLAAQISEIVEAPIATDHSTYLQIVEEI